MVSPQVRREAVTTLMRERSFGVTRACGLIRISRSLYRYRSRRPACVELRERICEIAALKRRYGYRRIHIKLRREGWAVNRKLTYRLYREAGLAVRRRKRKRIGPFERKPLPKPLVANDSWSMDFMSDGLHARMRGHRGRYIDHRIQGQGGARAPRRSARPAAFDHGRSWTGV
jgi:putative transposase